MNSQSKTKKPPLRRGWLHPVSVVAAARELGCSTAHLAKVLKGERVSTSLTSRYMSLVKNSALDHDKAQPAA